MSDDTFLEHLNLPHWNYVPRLEGLSGIYLNVIFRRLSIGLVNIFVPIYIYKVTGSLAVVFLFSGLSRLFISLILIPSAKFISKVGPDISMVLSSISRAVFLALLMFSPPNSTLFWLATVFNGLAIPFYWLPYHTAFAFESSGDGLTEELAQIAGLTRVASAFAPLIGGVISQLFGFSALFPIGVILLITSNLPVFLDEYKEKLPVSNIFDLGEDLFDSDDSSFFVAMFFNGVRMTMDTIFWPLFLFISVSTFERVGGVTTMTLLISLLFLNYAGKHIRKFKRKSLIFGNTTRSVLWFSRVLLTTPFFVITSDILYKLASIFVDIPAGLIIYDRAEEEKTMSFFLERSLMINLGRAFSSLLIFFLIVFGFSWEALPLVGFSGVLIATYFFNRFYAAGKQD